MGQGFSPATHMWGRASALQLNPREQARKPAPRGYTSESRVCKTRVRLSAARRTVGWLAPADRERGMRTLFERPNEVVFGEASAAAALARFKAAVADLPDTAVVVSHGTVISLYVAAQTGLDAFDVWQGLQLPEIVQI